MDGRLTSAPETGGLVSGPGSATHQLCGLGPNAWPLWASVVCKIRLYGHLNDCCFFF